MKRPPKEKERVESKLVLSDEEEPEKEERDVEDSKLFSADPSAFAPCTSNSRICQHTLFIYNGTAMRFPFTRFLT